MGQMGRLGGFLYPPTMWRPPRVVAALYRPLRFIWREKRFFEKSVAASAATADILAPTLRSGRYFNLWPLLTPRGFGTNG